MNTERIATAALTGTSVMTLFSYIVSQKKQQQFREPVLLTLLIDRLLQKEKNKESNTLKGWLLHYAVGTMFSAAYDLLWRKTAMKPTTSNGILLGAISGVIGIGVWKTTFKLHPSPPKIDFEKYYLHLLLAHILFGVCAAHGYKANLKKFTKTVAHNK